MLKIYTFLHDFTKKILNKEKIPLEVNLAGGNGSGKTYAVECWLSELARLCKVGILCVRAKDSDADNLWDELKEHFANDREGGIKIPLVYNTNENKREINFESGTQLRVLHLDKKTNTSSNLAGMRRFTGFKYIIVFIDEHSEVSNKQKNDIEIRARGDDKNVRFCWVSCCNPYNLSNYWVNYLNSNLSFNRGLLEKYGFQYRKLTDKLDNEKIFLYTNWRIAREVLSNEFITNIIKTWKYNKRLALTRDLGMPSGEEDSIYGDCLLKLQTPRYKQSDYLLGGIDVGFGTSKGTGLTGALFGTYTQKVGFDILGEWKWDNKIRVKSPDDIAREIVCFYIKQKELYYKNVRYEQWVNKRVMVIVDNSEFAFINMLNIWARRFKRNDIIFIRCKDKKREGYKINDRINYTIALIENGLIRFNNKVCNMLFEEMLNVKWKSNQSVVDITDPTKRVGADHLINAMEYLVENYLIYEYNLCVSKNYETTKTNDWQPIYQQN